MHYRPFVRNALLSYRTIKHLRTESVSFLITFNRIEKVRAFILESAMASCPGLIVSLIYASWNYCRDYGQSLIQSESYPTWWWPSSYLFTTRCWNSESSDDRNTFAPSYGDWLVGLFWYVLCPRTKQPLGYHTTILLGCTDPLHTANQLTQTHLHAGLCINKTRRIWFGTVALLMPYTWAMNRSPTTPSFSPRKSLHKMKKLSIRSRQVFVWFAGHCPPHWIISWFQ